MSNFPMSFEDSSDLYSDAKGWSLRDRARRLSHAIDTIWENPFALEALKHFHSRLAKFLRTLNHNGLFDRRFTLRARFVELFQDDAEGDDTREAVALDERLLEESCDSVVEFLVSEIPLSHTGERMKGLRAALFSFFLVEMMLRVEQTEDPGFALDLPVRLISRIEELLALPANAWARDTVIPDRFRALRVMIDVNTLLPGDWRQINETVKALDDEGLRALVRDDYLLQLRILEMIGKLWPFISGEESLSSIPEEKRKRVAAGLETLIRGVCRLRTLPNVRPARQARLRESVETLLARAIGVARSGLGWRIYTELRQGHSGVRFSSKDLFGTLMGEDEYRVAALNVVYAHEKRRLGSQSGAPSRLHGAIMKKYQPHFTGRLEFDEERDEFVVASAD